jgi:hypothetical protein
MPVGLAWPRLRKFFMRHCAASPVATRGNLSGKFQGGIL